MPEITARLSTALADRYRIEHELGCGGMATEEEYSPHTPNMREPESARFFILDLFEVETRVGTRITPCGSTASRDCLRLIIGVRRRILHAT